jgi:alkanesulfonate monooxygenase SsuD/methylene tetrahydromethanopterin reductase-like flavin-dependent oxidoreductase (luciferase family)
MYFPQPTASLPFGLMHQMWQLPSDSASGFFASIVEDVALADELGFDSVWLAEHHYWRDATYFSRVPDADMFLARLVPETERIRLATGIKILPLDEPLRIAERIFLLDQLSGGRAGCGLGQGSPDEMGIKKLGKEEKRQLFRDRLTELVEIVTTQHADGMRLVPETSISSPRVLWAGVRDELSVALAADLDVNLIIGEAEIGSRQAPFARHYRASGGRGEVRGARIVCVGETNADAVKAATASAELILTSEKEAIYHREAVLAGDVTGEKPRSISEVFERLEFVVGDPDEVARQLSTYVETVGLSALNIVVHSPGMEQASARRSLRLFMSEVVPQVAPHLTGAQLV